MLDNSTYWRETIPDDDGYVWVDLYDPRCGAGEHDWVATYRKYHNSWHVMWNMNTNPRKSDQLLSINIPEEQLRTDLQLAYLLTRGET